MLLPCDTRYSNYAYLCSVETRYLIRNEHGQHEIADAQGNARVLHYAPAQTAALLCQRHHPKAPRSRDDRDGRHALSAAFKVEEGWTAWLRMARKHTGTASQVLCSDR